MYAWILDESPGSYRWGEMPDPEPGPDDVVVSVVSSSALNHMDLWLTRGMPKPTLPHIPGCDVAGIVHAVGERVNHVAVGDEVVVNPGVSPVDEIIALGNDSPMGSGFGIWGEHDRGGHANLADRAGSQHREAADEPHLGGVRRVPAVLPHRVAHAAAGRGCKRATRCSSSASAAASPRGALALGKAVGATCRSPPAIRVEARPRASSSVPTRRSTLPTPNGRSQPTSWSRAWARRRGTSRSGR